MLIYIYNELVKNNMWELCLFYLMVNNILMDHMGEEGQDRKDQTARRRLSLFAQTDVIHRLLKKRFMRNYCRCWWRIVGTDKEWISEWIKPRRKRIQRDSCCPCDLNIYFVMKI